MQVMCSFIVSTPVVLHTATNYVTKAANEYYIVVLCRFLNCKTSVSRSVAISRLVIKIKQNNYVFEIHMVGRDVTMCVSTICPYCILFFVAYCNILPYSSI